MSEVAGLEGLGGWSGEHARLFDGGQPEGEGSGVVVASTSAVALDEWNRSEGLEARAWGLEVLAASGLALAGVHEEGVTSPADGLPVGWASWLELILRVDSDEVSWGFADDASRDVFLEVLASDWLHGHWHSLGSRQPVRLVVSGGNVTLLVKVAVHEWHSGKASHARTGSTKVLGNRSAVTGGVEKRVTSP